MKSHPIVSTVFLALALLLLAACGGADAEPPGAQIANPASENCVAQGGDLQIEERPDGGQIGVCHFEDNRQCEEWALMRGDCPAGGVRVTGYATEASRFCAITGGTYEVTGTNDAGGEAGRCTLPDATVCDADAYFAGACPPVE
jgi:putative hemolysin